MYRKTMVFFWLFAIILAANYSSGYSETMKQPSPNLTVAPRVIQRINLGDDLYLRQIGDGVFVITHVYPWPANALLVEMGDGNLVIAGSTYTPEAARIVLQWVERYFGKRQVVNINTGYHIDNLGGNQTFLDAKIPVYGSDMTVQFLQERDKSTRRVMLGMIGNTQSIHYKTYAEFKFYPPDHLFPIAEGLTLTFSGEKVEIFYPGPTQTPDKVVVYFPARQLLFGSCLILGGATLGNVAEADLKLWPDAIRKLFRFPVNVVIPGHGDRLDPGLIQHTLDLLLKDH